MTKRGDDREMVKREPGEEKRRAVVLVVPVAEHYGIAQKRTRLISASVAVEMFASLASIDSEVSKLKRAS